MWSIINYWSPVEESDKSYWFPRGLGIQFASFIDTHLVLTLVPGFHELLHQAKQFDIMYRAIEGTFGTSVAFTIFQASNIKLNYHQILGGRIRIGWVILVIHSAQDGARDNTTTWVEVEIKILIILMYAVAKYVVGSIILTNVSSLSMREMLRLQKN